MTDSAFTDKRILEALELIDDKFIAEITTKYEILHDDGKHGMPKGARRRFYLKLAAFAAAVILLMGLVTFLPVLLDQFPILIPPVGTQTSETTDAPETEAPEATTDIPESETDPPEETAEDIKTDLNSPENIEMIKIFEEVFAGERRVGNTETAQNIFGYFDLGYSEGEKVYLYMSDDVETVYLDLDRDGYTEAVVNANGRRLYVLRYDRENDRVNYYLTSYEDEIFYTNGEFGRSTYRYRVTGYSKYNIETERIEYAELGIKPAGEKVKWTKISVLPPHGTPIAAGNDKISAELSDTRPAGMNNENSLTYMAISDYSGTLMTYIVFTAHEKLTNVRLYKLDASRFEYEFGEKIWHTHELTEDKPLLAGLLFDRDRTVYGISFNDEAGEERHFAVRTRGDGGSLELVEYIPVGYDPYEEWLAAYADLGFGEVCISNILNEAVYDGPITYPAVFQIARLDINRDGVEDVLVTHATYSETVIFDGASKGRKYTIFGFRSLTGIRTNGIFFWTERAGTVQGASRFKEGSIDTEEVYRREHLEDDTYKYFVGGVEVTKEEYDKCLAETDAPKADLETLDVVWKAVDYLGEG